MNNNILISKIILRNNNKIKIKNNNITINYNNSNINKIKIDSNLLIQMNKIYINDILILNYNIIKNQILPIH